MMNARRTPVLSPRTLSAPPLPAQRRPRAASTTTRLPVFTVLLAAGAGVPACHHPACGTNRADELEAHGTRVARALRNGEGQRAMHEIGVALGVTEHPRVTTTTTTTEGAPEVMAPGAIRVMTPMPPQAPIPSAQPLGGLSEVHTVPPTSPSVPPGQQTRPHAPRPRPSPHEPSVLRPGGRMPTSPRPIQPPLQAPGGIGSAGPMPTTSMRRTA